MVVDSRKRSRRKGTRPLSDDAELSRVVSGLTRNMERIESIFEVQRRLPEERTLNQKRAERQWTQIRARIGKITIKTREILDEVQRPEPNSRLGNAI